MTDDQDQAREGAKEREARKEEGMSSATYFQENQALGKAQVDIAKLEIQVEHLMATVDDLKVSNAKLSEQIEGIRLLLSEAKGGWRMLMLFGGAGAAVGTVITWVMQHITFK